ncbi:MAG: NUDIX hydrolase [Desulfatitalea sp.]|nr:NUDIX hydrolase [Desulfatitalea sp.]NNJ99166.1 NUDIX hydrolase [Desulfatitalea sp.]
MNYCSHCGAPVALQVPSGDDRPRHVCESCGMIHYRNPIIVVGCIPQWEQRILLCRRNIEPQRGLWTLPAGYLETGETTMEGAARETHEETGACVTDLSAYLHFDIVHIHQIYMMFRARLSRPEWNPTEESSEVVLIDESRIPWNDIAFPVIKETLKFFFDDRRKGSFPFRLRRIHRRMNPAE